MTPDSRTAVRGGVVLVAATVAVSAGNYLLNVSFGRLLGLSEFGDVALMVNFMLLTTIATASLQLVAAHRTAQATCRTQAIRTVLSLERIVRLTVMPLALLLLVVSPIIGRAFQVSNSGLIAVMALGLPVHVLLSIDRGVLQGQMRMGPLALTFVIEMVARVVLSLLLVWAGWGALGATIGLNLGFLGAVIFARTVRGPKTVAHSMSLAALGQSERPASHSGIGGQVFLAMIATAVIANSDVLVSKWFFEPTVAGQYAAIALVGRAVFVFACAIQQVAVPLIARGTANGGAASGIEEAAIGATALIALVSAGTIWLLDEWVITTAFGANFSGISTLLGPYALATALFSIAYVAASLDLARGKWGGPLVLASGAAVQCALIGLMHQSPQQLVDAQLLATGSLVVAFGILRGCRSITSSSGWFNRTVPGADRKLVGAS